MKIEDFRPIRSQDSAPIKFDWLLTQESDWIIWTNQKITLIIFWLVKNGKDWNPAIPLVKRIFLVPDHIWPKTIKGQPALTHVIRNYVLLLVVPPLCLWWVTHTVTKALRLKILPGQLLPLFPNPPTLLTMSEELILLRMLLLHSSCVVSRAITVPEPTLYLSGRCVYPCLQWNQSAAAAHTRQEPLHVQPAWSVQGLPGHTHGWPYKDWGQSS